MTNNNCGGPGPCDMGEVRVLPTGGDSNAILCRRCFNCEIAFRQVRNRDLAKDSQFKLPTWGSLKVYRVADGNENTLYGEIVAAGIPFASHETDLYIPATPDALRILDRFTLERGNATFFINQAPPHKGERWINVPFAFLPAWEAKQRKAT